MDKKRNKQINNADIRAKNQLSLFMKRLHQSDIKVDKVFLFGSYAKGKIHKYSDLDICVISSKFGKNYLNENVQLMNLTDDLELPMDIIAYNPEDFADRYDTLAKEIKTYGIRIDQEHQLTTPNH